MFRSAFCKNKYQLQKGARCNSNAAKDSSLILHELQGGPCIRLRQLLWRKEASDMRNSGDGLACIQHAEYNN
jgi:hypothetical protein